MPDSLSDLAPLPQGSPQLRRLTIGAAAVITLDDGKLADLIAGKVALSALYQKGDMRVDGELALVRKLEQIL